jgi:CMP-N,N'-diacetyllegionaminic acid synthase
MRYFLIPARGGSKRILDKNLVDLGGAPLIAWTIATALAVAKDQPGSRVYVTSEDDKILDVAESCGAIPHKRPERLADDHASMLDVVREFFKTHEDCTDIVLLFPTVPFRSVATLATALAQFDQGTMEKQHTSLMSVSEHRGRPFGGVQIFNGKLGFSEMAEAYYRGQDTPVLYFANGAIFIMRREIVDKLNTQLFEKDTVPFVCYGIENLDIDTPFDLELARAWVTSGNARHRAPLATGGFFKPGQEPILESERA